MTDWVMHFDVDDPQILSKRLGAFAKRQGSAKQLSLLIGCDIRTAENIRAGRAWPIARHWLGLWIAFGEDVIEAVFNPERVEARLIREAAEREEARRQRIASASVVGDAQRLAAGLHEGLGPDDEALGPDNLDLFET